MSKRRKKVKKKNRKIVWIIESLLFIILISLLVLLKIFNPQEREKIEEKSEETVKPLVIQTQQRKLDLDQLHSSAGIVISLDDSKVIFQFQQDEKIFPASLTKIMTCILAIENINNLEATITLEPEIFDELYAQNASMAGFLPGENAKIIDILYGNILPSGGECSIALAEYVAGSEQAFVELMNEKAKDLGMNNTHFMNATGLHNESHYTTVKDIGILLQYALKNQTFNDIFQSKSYFVAPTDQHLSGFTFYSSMFKLRDPWELDEGEIVGGKTGYTNAANSTLVTYAEKDGMTLICVVMNTQSPNQFADTVNLFNYAFDNFQMLKIADNDKMDAGQSTVDNGGLEKIAPFVELDKNAQIVLPKTVDFSAAVSNVEEDNSDPGIVGTITYSYAGRTVGKAEIKTTGAVVQGYAFDNQSTEELEQQEESEIQVRPLTIILLVAAVILLVILLILLKRLYDNYYIIRHNREVRRRGREQKQSARARRKNRSRFGKRRWR